MKKIKVKLNIKKSHDQKLHIIYEPDQDQFLEKGKQYEFILEAKSDAPKSIREAKSE